MKIVIADPIFLTEEYRERLGALGKLEIYNSVPASQDEFVERIKDAEVIIVGRYGVNAKDSSHNKLCTSPIVRLDFHNQGRQSKFQ